MIRFLVVQRAVRADTFQYAKERGWTRLALTRYATPGKDDVRAVERPSEVMPTGGVMVFERGPGFADNPHAADFEKLVATGAARWYSLMDDLAAMSLDEPSDAA